MKKYLHQLIVPILFITAIFIGACGKSAPPQPLYQTQSTKIQKEIQNRKDKKNHEGETK